jgi:glycogen phosphorylase
MENNIMKPLRAFTIVPALPSNLEPLKMVAYNLLWSWNHEMIDLFRRLDRDLWVVTEHNPVRMLGQIKQERLQSMSEDDGFFAHLQRATQYLENYLSETTWYDKTYGKPSGGPAIAYFSAEFGLTECIPIYSGGLGVLSGDHLKSASDLGIPLVGVGLLYQKGYFRQYLNTDGWQNELNPKNDFFNMPIVLQTHSDGTPILAEIDLPDRKIHAQIWKVKVGRINLYLLDTNNPYNLPADKGITDELYGGDVEMRILQEIVLGIGGIQALKKLDIKPSVFHMNEGHSAFLAIERIRCSMTDNKLGFKEAKELTKSGNIFTTHTPVPAGIDRFSPQLMDKYFSHFYPQLNIGRNEFLALGRKNPGDSNESFSMAILAIKLASYINGVSKLHEQISKQMWSNLWTQVPQDEIPINAITNGIHPNSWISQEMAGLYDRYLGPTWLKKPADFSIWKSVEQIPAEELWRTHERRRERLVAFARLRLREQLNRQGALPSDIVKADEVLNPEALTIGFARRFATYKRATLLFQDPVRLAHIMRNKEYPVQIIFSGKAHPKDTPGKELIRKIVHMVRMEDFRMNIVFLEDYDMVTARYLVQGVDVWLNTPRRFMEASGTSGMKASVNGVLNMSILDGWWDEAYSPSLGWAIGHGENYEDFDYQDEIESQAIYNLLEKEIIPIFYDRGRDNLPRKWIQMMKNSMTHICPYFNTNRMVREYTERCYLPANKKFLVLDENNQQRAKDLTAWKSNIIKNWSLIRFDKVEEDGCKGDYYVGCDIKITASIYLGNLTPNDVSVEIYHGYLSADNVIEDGSIEPVTTVKNKGNNLYRFSGSILCRTSGRYGYTVRVLPKHENLTHAHETGLIVWADN